MIFTVGNRESYEQYLATDPNPQKLGKGKDHEGRDYGGGCAFQSFGAAQAHLRDVGLETSYSVYGLLADWNGDTEQLPGEPYRRLLRDATIVRAAA